MNALTIISILADFERTFPESTIMKVEMFCYTDVLITDNYGNVFKANRPTTENYHYTFYKYE